MKELDIRSEHEITIYYSKGVKNLYYYMVESVNLGFNWMDMVF